MKFLDLTELELVNHALDFVSSDCHVIGRIETYSCKATTYDKKLSKQLNSRFSCSTSPNREEPNSLKQFNSLNDNYFLNPSLESSYGSLDASAVKKIFCYLISTMNSAFPDYDFSYLQPKNFIHFESAEMVINSINQTLISSGGQELVNCSGLWEAINPIIEFKDCDVFSFVPDFDSEPFSGPGSIWYFNYFFYNRKLKRILFFTCTGFSLKVNPYDEALGSSISEYGHVNDGFDYEEVVMADIEL